MLNHVEAMKKQAFCLKMEAGPTHDWKYNSGFCHLFFHVCLRNQWYIEVHLSECVIKQSHIQMTKLTQTKSRRCTLHFLYEAPSFLKGFMWNLNIVYIHKCFLKTVVSFSLVKFVIWQCKTGWTIATFKSTGLRVVYGLGEQSKVCVS